MAPGTPGARDAFLALLRPLLFAAALAVAALVCLPSFVLGRIAARILRLDALVTLSTTLACGVKNGHTTAVALSTGLLIVAVRVRDSRVRAPVHPGHRRLGHTGRADPCPTCSWFAEASLFLDVISIGD
ncbi:hypothetical protein [Streptomyces sp. NBC_01451]|uniref:hypothetical protein n=1 Tax=Streptomyces sp. NBC_01451 TaxID=2903872 RepID=UPI002E33386E|nr:hypothetical protein [Streptomyces sp. NBC_01451]